LDRKRIIQPVLTDDQFDQAIEPLLGDEAGKPRGEIYLGPSLRRSEVENGEEGRRRDEEADGDDEQAANEKSKERRHGGRGDDEC
jgi:hypothetical protein